MRSHRPTTNRPAAPTAAPAQGPGRGARTGNADQIDRLRDRRAAATKGGATAGPTLPATTMDLLASRTLSVRRVATYTGAAAMPPEIAARLMRGVRQEGVSDAQSLDEVLTSYIDEGTVDVYSISARAGGDADTWLRFTCGDTEVGYIFRGEALKAIIGDQDINPVGGA
jgi:hypothetical protein